MEMLPQKQQQQEAACIESTTPVPAAIVPYYPKILQWSVGKIADSRRRRTGVDLRRNLLIANVIFKARNGILQLRARQLLEERTTTPLQSTASTSDSDTAAKSTSATDNGDDGLAQPSAILSPGDRTDAASETCDATAPTSENAIGDLSDSAILVPMSDITSPTSDTPISSSDTPISSSDTPISSSDIPVPTSDTTNAASPDLPEATSVGSNSGIPLPTFSIRPPSPTEADHIPLPCPLQPSAAADLSEAAALRCRKRRSSCQLLTLPTASPASSGTSAADARSPLSAPPHSPPKRAMLLQGETPLAQEQQQLLVLQTSYLDLNVVTTAAAHTPPCLMCSS